MNWRRFILSLFAVGVLCVSLPGQTGVGELSATDASVKGAVVMSAGNTRVVSGSDITAGQATASLRLERGGEVRICPHSSLSVTASPNGHELMLALGTGAIETHFRLASSADSVLTPDFRILLAGPGEFHFAVASDPHGNTCVRALPSDTASVIVNELMGDGVYQVRPGEQVLFRGGSVKDPGTVIPPDCGCPVPPQAQRAEESTPVPLPTPAPPVGNAPASLTAPVPQAGGDDVHVSVDAPFVFHAEEPAIPPPPMVARLQAQRMPPLMFLIPPVQPPPSAAKPAQKKGFFGRVRSFFSTVFH
jgi:hypothetical protein